MTSQRLETVTLPATTIEVAGGAETFSTKRLWRIAGLALIALAAVAVVWRRGAWLRRRAPENASEAGRFARLQRACRAGDAPAAFNALLAWLDVCRGGAGTATLRDDLLASHGDDELRRQVTALEDVVLRRAAHPDGQWDGSGLAAALRRVRRDEQPRRGAGVPALPALNPR